MRHLLATAMTAGVIAAFVAVVKWPMLIFIVAGIVMLGIVYAVLYDVADDWLQ